MDDIRLKRLKIQLGIEKNQWPSSYLGLTSELLQWGGPGLTGDSPGNRALRAAPWAPGCPPVHNQTPEVDVGARGSRYLSNTSKNIILTFASQAPAGCGKLLAPKLTNFRAAALVPNGGTRVRRWLYTSSSRRIYVIIAGLCRREASRSFEKRAGPEPRWMEENEAWRFFFSPFFRSCKLINTIYVLIYFLCRPHHRLYGFLCLFYINLEKSGSIIFSWSVRKHG